MTIDKKKLVELLVDKTSMNKEEVEAQLDQLIERILDAAKRGKALEIKEFGVFYFDEEGELRFDAAEELSTEISFKYAGMKPVELKPERDTSISEVEYQGDEDDDLDEDPFVSSFDEPVFEEDQEKEFDVESEKESELKRDEEEDFSFDFDEEESGDKKDTDESIIDDPFSSEALEPLEEPVEREEKRTNIQDIKPVSRKPVKNKDNTGVFILIAIVVIAVLIGGYFYFISTQSQSSTEPTQATQTQMQSGVNENGGNETDQTESGDSQVGEMGTTSDPQTAANNQVSAEQGGANEGTEEQIVSNNGVSAAQTNQDLYGLRGTVIEEANDGYSIVLHSFRAEENAMQAANQLRADGYRVTVNSRTVYENLVWRVSVGQFESLGAAQQATTQLPEPYSTQNFIQRIRIN